MQIPCRHNLTYSNRFCEVFWRFVQFHPRAGCVVGTYIYIYILSLSLSLSLFLPIESHITLDPGPRITLACPQDLVIWVGRANKRPGAPLKEARRDCPSEGEVDISILCSDLFFCDCFPFVTI